MLRKNILISLALITSIFWGCSKTFTDLEEYENYINSSDSPFIQKMEKGDFIFTLKYMPSDAMILNSIKYYLEEKEQYDKKDSESTFLEDLLDEIQQERENYSHSLYFHLTIEHKAGKDMVYDFFQFGQRDYSAWLNKLSFGLKEDIFLYSEKKGKIPQSIYEMERTFGMTKSRSFLLVFPREFNQFLVTDLKNTSLIIKEFGLGIGSVEFEKVNLKETIKLKLGDVNDTIL